MKTISKETNATNIDDANKTDSQTSKPSDENGLDNPNYKSGDSTSTSSGNGSEGKYTKPDEMY